MEEEPLLFSLNINSNDSTWGTGSFVGLSDSIAEITAIPYYGYHFDHWSFGSTANPDTIMLTDDASITAYFAKNQYTVTGVTNDSIKGFVYGSAMVDYLDTVTLTAMANYGYQFIRWSDYCIENPRQVSATGNITKTAVFDFGQFSLTVMADTSIHGTCTGGGTYNYLSEHTITASANYGYHFDHWNDGDTNNPRVVTLTQDTMITAFFSSNQYSITMQSDNTSLGDVLGSGTYNYLDTVTISAQAVEHYHFIHWNDGNRDNPRHVVVTGDLAFTAFFAIDTHTVSVAVNDIARGMVEASGTEFIYGTPCTVTATAYTGYTFAGWSNGVNATPYTFAVLNDVELTALFVAEGEQTYTVTVVSDDPTMGTVSGGGQALDGGTVTIRAAGNPGYHFLRWNDNNTDSVRTVEVHGNVTYTAYFASNSTEAIDDVKGSNIKVYAIDGRIVVVGRENRPVWVLDMYGRVVDNGQLPSGVYLVKVGNLPARKVVVIR